MQTGLFSENYMPSLGQPMMNSGLPIPSVDVLKTYGEHSDDELKHLLFYGGLDTGIDLGRLQIPAPENDSS